MRHMKQLWKVLAAVMMLTVLARGAQAAPFDRQFIDSMVPHHESALMMAQMAVTKARLPQVKALARGIISDQQREIAQMKAWRKAWFGNAQVPMSMTNDKGIMMSGMKMSNMKMTMPGTMMGLPMKMEMDMGKLSRAKGRDFDKIFLQMMIPHHASAIVMADEARNMSGRPQLRNLARNIIASQAREIGQMQGILDRYFRRN